MKIETSYSYETKWTLTQEADLLLIIIEEVGDADPKGVLDYVKQGIKKGKIISVGSCKFRVQQS